MIILLDFKTKESSPADPDGLLKKLKITKHAVDGLVRWR